jgi:pyridoxine/pyridoxamine 5'-phosphate oxidase
MFSSLTPAVLIFQPPNLRTVNIAQISSDGIDFVLKRGSMTANSLADGSPVSILHQHGRFLPGECAEQWRGEGTCDAIKLESVMDCIPLHTKTSMIASSRVSAEKSASDGKEGVSSGRLAIESKSHLTEIMQTTQRELSEGGMPLHVLERYIAAFRFRPERMEFMMGGPDSVMWDRWEWLRDTASSDEAGQPVWNDPKQLMPH